MDTKPLQHSEDFVALCNDAKKRVDEINTDQVSSMINNDEHFYLIDVREQNEFDQGHIPEALGISKGWIEAKVHTVVNNKKDTIVLYCGSGNRSILAADNLKKMGYTNIFSMAGGIKKWVNENKPTSEKP